MPPPPEADPILRRLPSPYLLFALAVAGVGGILAAVRGPVDGDYYWHVATGRLIAQSGAVASSDPFSFTVDGKAWVVHEWGAALLMHLAVSGLGPGLAALLFGVAAVGGPLAIGAALRREGMSTLAVAGVASLAVVVILPHVSIRPQAISWLLLGLLVAGLLRLRAEHAMRAWLAVPFFALWANLDGQYVIGLGVLGIYALFSALGRSPLATRRDMVLAVLVGSGLATAATPAGLGGLLSPVRYVTSGDWGQRHLADWQSPDLFDPVNVPLLVLMLGLALVGLRRTPGWLVVLAIMGVAGGLLAIRQIPLAGLLAMPALATGAAARLPERHRPASPTVGRARRAAEAALAGLVIAAAALLLPSIPELNGDRVIPNAFPVAATDALERVAPDENVLTEFHWGGYLIWRLHEAGSHVFVDGRLDVYPTEVLDDYLRIRNASPGWEELVAEYEVAVILLPPAAAVIDAAREVGWCEAHRDAVAAVIVRCP